MVIVDILACSDWLRGFGCCILIGGAKNWGGGWYVIRTFVSNHETQQGLNVF